MERHSQINRMYREQEFAKKLEVALNTRIKGYEDVIEKDDDLVYYQTQNGKA